MAIQVYNCLLLIGPSSRMEDGFCFFGEILTPWKNFSEMGSSRD